MFTYFPQECGKWYDAYYCPTSVDESRVTLVAGNSSKEPFQLMSPQFLLVSGTCYVHQQRIRGSQSSLQVMIIHF